MVMTVNITISVDQSKCLPPILIAVNNLGKEKERNRDLLGYQGERLLTLSHHKASSMQVYADCCQRTGGSNRTHRGGKRGVDLGSID
jgi:hypothetical protein